MFKCILIFLFLIFAGTEMYPQEINNPVLKPNEIGLSLLGISNSALPHQLNESNWNFWYANGLLYKHLFDQATLRIRFELQTSSQVTLGKGQNDSDTMDMVSNYSGQSIAIGAERNLFEKGILKIFYGGEIAVFSGKLTSYNQPLSGFGNFHKDVITNGIGLHPFIGIGMTFKNSIRISLESGVSAIGYYERISTYDDGVSGINDETDSITVAEYLNPVSSFSVSFLF